MAKEAFQLTKEQRVVLKAVVLWLKKMDKPYISLGGYAGTGKTTLLSYFRRLLHKAKPKAKIAFCSYTGKATRVLEQTLIEHEAKFPKDSVSTIHSLIYAPVPDKKGGISYWKLRDEIKADMIVVDEASMVDEKIWQDLLSFGLPILAVGDHGQLPPIEGNFNLMNKPDLRLEKIHRQAQDNPIIHVSMLAREKGEIPIQEFGPGVVKLNRYESWTGQEVEEVLQNYDDDLLVLTGYNSSRVQINQAVREYQFLEDEKPQPGDRVICLKNNWEKGIYNGMLGRIKHLTPVKDDAGNHHWYDAEISLEGGQVLYTGRISAHQFGQSSTLQEYEGLQGKALGDLFDYGYALTVHKAQGSQAKRVLLFEERNKHMSDDDWRRWLYTGVTRAEEQLMVIGTER